MVRPEYVSLPHGRGSPVRGNRDAQGFSLVAVGTGWLLQWPVMVAAGMVVGLEETIETSIAAWALAQEPEGCEGFG